MSDYRKPLPRLDDTNAPFWEGARQGELRLQRCTTCGTHRFPARRRCTQCGGEESRWVPVSGRGTVWSFCHFHQVYFEGFRAEMPYNVVQVRLEEGAMLFSNLVGVERGQIRIGMAVEPYFDPVTSKVTLVKFKPSP